jgi:hypothetical protein
MKEAAQMGHGWNVPLPWLAVVAMLAVVVQSRASTNLVSFETRDGRKYQDVRIVSTNRDGLVIKVPGELGFKKEAFTNLMREMATIKPPEPPKKKSLEEIHAEAKLAYITTNELVKAIDASLELIKQNEKPEEHCEWFIASALRTIRNRKEMVREYMRGTLSDVRKSDAAYDRQLEKDPVGAARLAALSVMILREPQVANIQREWEAEAILQRVEMAIELAASRGKIIRKPFGFVDLDAKEYDY